MQTETHAAVIARAWKLIDAEEGHRASQRKPDNALPGHWLKVQFVNGRVAPTYRRRNCFQGHILASVPPWRRGLVISGTLLAYYLGGVKVKVGYEP